MQQQALDFNPASDTSRDASILNLPNRARDRDRVLKAIADAGPHGLTDFELETATGIKQTSCGKRRLELQRDGFVARRHVTDPATGKIIPDRRPSPTGAPSAVWHLARYSHPTYL